MGYASESSRFCTGADPSVGSGLLDHDARSRRRLRRSAPEWARTWCASRDGTMSPSVRKLMLTAHVVCSVGWLGAVATFLVLALAGLSELRADVMGGVYLAMD